MSSTSFKRALTIAAAFCAAWLPAIGRSLADCQPQDLNVVLNTGWDESTSTVIPAGGTDDDWDVTFTPTGPSVPFDANVVNPHPAWLTMPNSQWISADYSGPNGFYHYRTCWCLHEDYTSPNLGFAIRADDDATVLVNGTEVLSLPDGTFNDPIPLGISVFPGLLHAGENCIDVIVENKFGGPTGFNLTGWMTAVGGECCDCHEADIHDDAATGVDDLSGNLIASGSDDDEWMVTAEPGPGIVPRPAGVINTHPAWNVIPGTSWISANATGPNGLYSYEKCWCMNSEFQDAELSMQLLADDRASVFLNGTPIGATPLANAYIFPATSITVTDQDLFLPGENCVRIDVFNTNSVVTGLDVDMTITAVNAECCPCTDLPPDAEGWWPLNETAGPTAVEVLNGHDGTWTSTGVPPFAIIGEYVGNSLFLDGIDDYVEVPDDPGLDFGGGQDFSFDAWIKSPTPVRKAIIHKKVPGLPSQRGYSFYASAFLHLEIADGTNFLICSGTTNIADDEWHFVAATVDRSLSPNGIVLYVDGAVDQVCDPTTVTGSLENAQPLHFGAAPLNAPSARMWWKGQLDEIEIFRRALTNGPTPIPTEVEDLYFALNTGKCPLPACEDSSGVPMCAGVCPAGLTCVAGPPPAGPCQCVQQPVTCGGSAPACNGLCPDEDDVCVANGPNCFCESTPQCGGPGDHPICDDACPAGLVCQNTGNVCECVPEVVPCGETFYPQCNGACPPGEVCRNVFGSNACACAPEPIACGDSPYPACGGACPVNQECKPNQNQGCDCITCGTGVPADPSGPIDIKLPTREEIRWTPVTCALVYNLYRGIGPDLIDQNTDGLADDYGSCYIGDVIETRAVDPDRPQPAHIHWYLVTAENFAGEGSLGTNSIGQTRQATTVCP